MKDKEVCVNTCIFIIQYISLHFYNYERATLKQTVSRRGKIIRIFGYTERGAYRVLLLEKIP